MAFSEEENTQTVLFECPKLFCFSAGFPETSLPQIQHKSHRIISLPGLQTIEKKYFDVNMFCRTSITQQQACISYTKQLAKVQPTRMR